MVTPRRAPESGVGATSWRDLNGEESRSGDRERLVAFVHFDHSGNGIV